MTLRFLQLSTFYSAYLKDFYASQPRLTAASHHEQIKALLDGYSGVHIFSQSLKAEGFETFQVAINDLSSQSAWLREQGFAVTERTDFAEIVARQIEWFKPDIVYTTDVTMPNSQLLSQLTHKPSVVAGWRGFPLPADIDLSCYDLILTSFDRMFEEARTRGAKSVERFHPGFPEDSPVLAEPRKLEFDVVFSGSVTGHHVRRIALLNILAERSRETGFSFGLFMPDVRMLSPLAQSLNQPARWGHDMLRLMRNAGIVINIDIDDFAAQPPNMRLIEATGAGAFLLTPYHKALPDFFEPGTEVETFRTPNEMMAKVQFYLGQPEAREEIARRGQERCLRDHSLAVRTAWFRDILMRAVKN